MLLYYQYNVATRFTQVQQVSIRLYSEFVTDMSWTNCYHVNTEFNDNYCYWYLFQLFPSVNHANQFLYVYLDVKFASTKQVIILAFSLAVSGYMKEIIMFISADIIYGAFVIH